VQSCGNQAKRVDLVQKKLVLLIDKHAVMLPKALVAVRGLHVILVPKAVV
jgi:hypothetical protein